MLRAPDRCLTHKKAAPVGMILNWNEKWPGSDPTLKIVAASHGNVNSPVITMVGIQRPAFSKPGEMRWKVGLVSQRDAFHQQNFYLPEYVAQSLPKCEDVYFFPNRTQSDRCFSFVFSVFFLL